MKVRHMAEEENDSFSDDSSSAMCLTRLLEATLARKVLALR